MSAAPTEEERLRSPLADRFALFGSTYETVRSFPVKDAATLSLWDEATQRAGGRPKTASIASGFPGRPAPGSSQFMIRRLRKEADAGDEQRKRLSVRIKELQPKATNVAIAKVVGAGEATIRRDTASPNGDGKVRGPKAAVAATSPNGEPPPATKSAELSGSEVAKLATKAEAKQEKVADALAEGAQ